VRGPFEILAALGLPTPKGVLQVGANSGQELDYFRANGIQHAAMVEPLDGPFAMLCARCQGSPGFVPIQALCGSRDNQMVDFHVASNNGESSSMLEPANHLADYPWVKFQQVVKMRTFTLDSLFAALAAQRPEVAAALDMLFMDVQGAELHVLKGAARVLQTVNAIYTETGVGGGYKGDVELLDLMQYLKVYDFQLYELETNDAGWGNALFVKRRRPAAA
jgi:FkbM family methyltransferase